LRACANRLPAEAFLRRKLFLNHPQTGLLTKKSQKPKSQEGLAGMQNPMMDPSNMGGMMKGQAAMLISNVYFVALYNTIDFLFSGFIAAKLPFMLTRGWKGMFQAGIDLPHLEVTYVSSSSWYLLIFTGLREVNTVLFGPGSNINMMASDPVMASVATQGQGGGGMFTDPTKQYVAEKESLQLREHDWDCQDSLKRLLKSVGYKSTLSE